MHFSRDSHSPPPSGGNVTRAAVGPSNDTAQPSLTSGFGAVIEKEHELQSATEGRLGESHGAHSADVDRMLRYHQTRLAANIALLGQRYEMLPHPRRFHALQGGHRSKTQHPAPASRDALRNLVAQHRTLLGDIDALITQGSDGQRGELILAEVGRNHEDMAWMLSALIEEDDATVAVAPAPGTNEPVWENEGGATRATSSPTPSGAVPNDLAV